jgi:hypothetical protein
MTVSIVQPPHPPATGAVAGWPRILLRLEGGATLAAAVAAYVAGGWSWWLFAGLFLAPDIGFAGFLVDRRVGAAVYNALHTYAVPTGLGLSAILAGAPAAFPVAIIWIAHIGFDRLLGYGLKYPTGFGDTHLGTIGRRRG